MRYVLLYTSSLCFLAARFLLAAWPTRLSIAHHAVIVYAALRHKDWAGRTPEHWDMVRKQSEAGLFVGLSLARLWEPLALVALPFFTRPETWLHDASLALSLSLSPLQWLLAPLAAYLGRVGPRPVVEQADMHRNAVDRVLRSKVNIFLLSSLYLGLWRQLKWACVLVLLDYSIAKWSPAYHFLDWGNLKGVPLFNSVKIKI